MRLLSICRPEDIALTRPPPNRVQISNVSAEQRDILSNLLQLYLHDFSEFAPLETPHGEVDSEGRFPFESLDPYWREEAHRALLITFDDRTAGFVLLHDWSALDRDIDHAIAEFFVMRKYRRNGVGKATLKLLLERYPGRWEIPVAFYNKPALKFWRKVIPLVASGRVEATESDNERWRGTVYSFRAALA